jgi:glutathione S-transferase
MITLYQFDISPFCDKIRRILNVKGRPYTLHEVRIAEAPRLKSISPTGKFPAIDVDGQVIVDSTEIAHFLESKFPAPALMPKDPREAALVHLLEDWADESLYFYEMTMRLGWANNAKRWVPELLKHERGFMKAMGPRMLPSVISRVTRAQGVGRKRRDQVLKEVDRHVRAIGDLLGDRNWLVGDALTLADIAVFSQLACISGTEEGAAIIQAVPQSAAWLRRVDQATGVRPQAKAA